MAHPMRKEAADSSTAKFRKMTEHYGAADPKMVKSASVTKLNTNGAQDSVGYGADSSAPKPRGDRPARKTKAANPVSTYRKGGKVKDRKTHEVLGIQLKRVGRLVITDEVGENVCTARITMSDDPAQLGDLVHMGK